MDKKHLASILIILIVGAIAYANSFGNDFVYDDMALIVKNPHIKNLSNIGRAFFTGFFPEGEGGFNYYRPVTTILNTLDYAVWRLNPLGYHLTNFLLHFICACLVYFILFYLAGSFLVPLFLSLIFICHPSATQAITYMPSRSDPLAFMFMLASLILFARWQKGRGRTAPYLCSIAAFAMACMSKETSVIFPVFLFIYAARKFEAAPYFIVSGVYLFARQVVLQASGNTFFSAENIAFATRLISAPVIVMRYLKAFFAPSTYIMEQPTILYNNILNPAAALSWTALLIIIALMIKYRKGRWVTGALWFLVFIFPVTGILSINNFFYHHWLYIPSLGILAVLALLPASFRRPLLVYAAVMAAVCCALTIRQNRHFKNELTLYEEIIANFPGADRVRYNLAVVYLKNGRVGEARQQFEETLKLKPDYVEAQINLGYLDQQKKLFGAAEKAYKKSIAMAPDKYMPYYYLANLYNEMGRAAESIAYYEKAAGLRPLNTDIYFDLGRALEKTGNAVGAAKAYQKAAELDPKNKEAFLNLGTLYAQNGDYARAKEIWERGLKNNPDAEAIKRNLEKLKAISERYFQKP